MLQPLRQDGRGSASTLATASSQVRPYASPPDSAGTSASRRPWFSRSTRPLIAKNTSRISLRPVYPHDTAPPCYHETSARASPEESPSPHADLARLIAIDEVEMAMAQTVARTEQQRLDRITLDPQVIGGRAASGACG